MRMILALLLALHVASPAGAQTDAVQGVIAAQILAFQRDDFATAFTFASPAIRGVFGTPERFGMMVRRGFPMVWRPAEVQYLERTERGGLTYQNVLIQDGAGAYFALEYEMLATPEGWQINGVRILEEPAIAA